MPTPPPHDDLLSEADKLAAGQQFGHFQIITLLGVGGMGAVYLAHDARLGRKIALKLLPSYFTNDADRVGRFAQEARSASALNHPNILTIYEIGRVADRHFIATEFVEGETLHARMGHEGKLPLMAALDMAIQIASALAAAHAAGVVHRDIKPENVMVRRDQLAKVLDFGLAKLTEKNDDAPIDLLAPTRVMVRTTPGMVMGTVEYMSPEQARGKVVDARTDIFSLGIVLYEMLTGSSPFAGETTSDVLAAILKTDPAAPCSINQALPVELNRIVSKALAKDCAERYQTTNDLLADLRQLQKRLEFEAAVEREYGITPTDGLQPPPATTHNANAVTRRFTTETSNSIAVLPFANISNEAENEYFCDGLAEELLNALAKIEDLQVAARTSAFSFKGKHAEVGEVGRILRVQTVLEGSVRRSGNRVRVSVQLVNAANGYQLWAERYDRELHDIFDMQDEITLAVVAALKVKLLGAEKAAMLKRYTDNAEAYLLYLKGVYYRWKLTPEEFGKSRNYFQQAVAADPAFALAYFGLCSYYGYGTAWGLLSLPPQEGWAKAEAAMAKVMELDASLPEVLIAHAFKLVHYREWAAAGTELAQAARLNPKFPEIHHLYSFYLLAVGRFAEAITEAERALELDPLSLNYSRFLGLCLYFARRYDAAVEQFKQTLELDPNNASVHEALGDAFAQQEMYDEAVSAWQRALTLEGDDELAALLTRTYAGADLTAAARAVARQRVERMHARVTSGGFILAIGFARAYVQLGDQEQAFHWLEKACDERNVFPLLMNSDPFYDSVRADPRFAALLRQIGLQPGGHAQGSATNEPQDAPTILLAPGTTDAPAVQTKTEEIVTPPMLPPKQQARRSWLLLASLGLLLLSAVGFFAYRSLTANAGRQIESIAVLPFANESGNSDVEYLSDGMTESLINSLSQLPKLSVKARSSVFRYKGKEVEAQQVAAELSVQAILNGRVVQRGDDLVLYLSLVDARNGNQLWGEQYHRKLGDLVTLQSEIARDVSQKLRVRLSGADEQKLAKDYTANVEAYQLYLKGRYHVFKLTPPEVQQGISYLQQAIEIDPGYALAYVGLSEAYRSLALAGEMNPSESLPKARAAAQKAVELDDTLAEAHTALGITIFWYDWDWSAAENQYKRALELNPNVVDVHLFYAHLLSNTGRHAEALAEVKRARELDPLAPFVGALEGQFLVHAGRADEALARLQKTSELAPNFWFPHVFASSAYIEKGMYREAIAEAQRAKALGPNQTTSDAYGGYALAKSGRRDEAQAVLAELQQLTATRFVPPYHIALIYNGLGETDKALDWLEKGYEQRDPKMAFLQVEPKWNNLRAAPRFQDLLRRVGFKP